MPTLSSFVANRPPRRLHGRLVFDDWTVPDPLHEPLQEALLTARGDLPRLTQAQAHAICDAACAYLHFAAHPASTASIVAQLRALRRAVRSPSAEK